MMVLKLPPFSRCRVNWLGVGRKLVMLDCSLVFGLNCKRVADLIVGFFFVLC